MLRRTIISLLLIILTFPARGAFRGEYNFYYKTSPGQTFRLVPDMTLDFDGGKAAFYSEFSFEKDSIRYLAFDKNGQIVNEQEQSKIYEMSGLGFPDWNTFQNLRSTETIIWFQRVTLFIKGTGMIEPPVWELLKEEQIICGFKCHKARADYLGRIWSVWYTEEIPLNLGPWLLHGLPGLIVYASDADDFFRFELRNIRTDVESRYTKRIAYYEDYSKRSGKRRYDYPLRDAYPMVNRAWSNLAYFDELSGQHLAMSQLVDKDGSKTPVPLEIPHIPLIPDEYWKSSRRQGHAILHGPVGKR